MPTAAADTRHHPPTTHAHLHTHPPYLPAIDRWHALVAVPGRSLAEQVSETGTSPSVPKAKYRLELQGFFFGGRGTCSVRLNAEGDNTPRTMALNTGPDVSTIITRTCTSRVRCGTWPLRVIPIKYSALKKLKKTNQPVTVAPPCAAQHFLCCGFLWGRF